MVEVSSGYLKEWDGTEIASRDTKCMKTNRYV